MSLSKLNSKISSFAQEIEFGIILVWVILYPQKRSPVFYLVAGFLFAVFSLQRIRGAKNVALYPFSWGLLFFNVLLIAGAFLSPYPLKSLSFIVDLLLISVYSIFFYMETRDRQRYFLVLGWVISISSLVNLGGWIYGPSTRQISILFANPILQGIASGIGAIIFFHQLLIKSRPFLSAVALGINLLALMLAGAKAAFLGLFLVLGFMLLLHRKKWLVPLFLLFAAILAVPNPFRASVVHSLKNDPYVSNRLDIWKMSLAMFRDNPWTGIGPDMFSQAARRYNFPQEIGPARFWKVPESPHSDFLKLPVETGLLGFFLILFFWTAVGRKTFSRPRFELGKMLLLFLVFQMLFFNLVFNPTFFFILLFVLKTVFEEKAHFRSVSLFQKTFYAFFLLLLWIGFYLLPSVSALLIQRSRHEPSAVRAFRELNLASLADPLNDRIVYEKALMLSNFFRQTGSLESWTAALDCLKRAEKLNPGFIDGDILESNLYLAVLHRNATYPGLADEIIAPLVRAERYDPFNPFLKLKKAVVYLAFGHTAPAREEAFRALAIEPEFVSALYLLHGEFGYCPDEREFSRRIDRITEKGRKLNLRPDSYLFNLFRIPARGGVSGR